MHRALRLCLLASVALGATGCRAASECEGAACDGDAGAPACTVRFSGNYDDAVTSASPCASLAKSSGSAPQDWILDLAVRSTVGGGNINTHVQIDLGASPSSGTFSEASVGSWSAVAVRGIGCEYSAGSTAVPSGAFTLQLTEVSGLDAAPVVHGTLSVLQHVAAPPGTDCGTGDTETVDFEF